MNGYLILSNNHVVFYQIYIFVVLSIIFFIFGYDYIRKGSTNNIFKTIIGIILSVDFLIFIILDFKNVFLSFYMFYIGNFMFINDPPLVCIKEDAFSKLVCFIYAPQHPTYFIFSRFIFFAFSLVPINYILSANFTILLLLIRKKSLGDLLYPPSWFWVMRPPDFIDEKK